MQTSIFDMTFTLPPMIHIEQVEKANPYDSTGKTWLIIVVVCC